MSRLGKLPIEIPKGVTATITPTRVDIKGPKGQLTVETHARVDVKQEGEEIIVRRFDDQRQSRAYHGLYQRLIRNAVIGVTEGYSKELEIQGVGYRAAMQGQALVLSLGHSHPIEMHPPEGITYKAPKPTEVIVEGYDKQVVGQMAALIRSHRPPEPYKGKGVRYKGEYVRRKVGKAAKK